MPVYTTLEFFRTKQTIESFETKYPKSISGLREAVLLSFHTIDGMLDEVTHQYLEGYDSHEAFIRDKMISIYLLMGEVKADGVYRRHDFEHICDNAGTQNNLIEHISKVKATSNHLIEYNPNAFIPITDLIEKILGCLEKYFRSFYVEDLTMNDKKYIETLINYEDHRRSILHDVKEKLRSIFTFSNQFNNQGIKLEQLSEDSLHLARRTKSTDVPCLLLFPECCTIIKECKNLLHHWIELDKEYPKNIKIDLELMHEEKTASEEQRRTYFDNYIKAKHGLDEIRRNYDEMCTQKSTMEKKLRQCETVQHELLVKIKHNEIKINKGDLLIKDLEKKIEESDFSKKLELDLDEHKYFVQKMKKILKENRMKLDRVDVKVEWYSNFIKLLESKKAEVNSAETEAKESQRLLENEEAKLDKVRRYIKLFENIYFLKTSNATLKKIFHNLELRNRLNFLAPTKGDPSSPIKDDFSSSILVTSEMIDKDWIKLYINLPFHPPRGNAELESDIAKILKEQVRGLNQDMALQSLNNWRRFHIRANLSSLVQGLKNINRIDIIKKIDSTALDSLQLSTGRSFDERIPPMSATTRFLIKYYPNLQVSSNNSS